jgi:ABC-type glycerol-3-phosphate transport system substrate-binding protein
VDEKLKPRILRRDPPDIAYCRLPVWKLIVAHKLLPLDPALDSPAYGQPSKSWRQTLAPGILADFQYEGKSYAMPECLNAWVCWYNKRMFREHGWQPPNTWGEFTRLCERVKAAGVAPIAYQGKYPYYAWPIILSIYQRLVPFDRWYAMQDMKPGAFTDPEFIHAARLMQELSTRYFEPGALAMTHTDSQMEWVNGKAAMIFCGLWLKHEMEDALPPGFEMSCFAIPMVEGGRGDPRAVYGGGAENFFAMADGKHPKEALDFLKYMMSIEPARVFAQKLDSVPPVIGCTKGVPISPALQSALDVLDRRSRLFVDRLGELYPGFNHGPLNDNIAGLVAGSITAEQCGANLEAAMDAIRRDPDIYKPPARGVPAQ